MVVDRNSERRQTSGRRSKGISVPGCAADLDNGAKVFADICASCHGRDRLGQRTAKGLGYQFSPLAGPDSYNNGASITRVLTAASFVRHNVPFGTTLDTPVLSNVDAYDVAAYMNSFERPVKPDLDDSTDIRLPVLPRCFCRSSIN
jgi:thiosulfate dehydrogenase